MPRKRRSRLYTRNQGGVTRYYGDFRDFSDVGGRREALKPAGADVATSDEQLAQAIIADRLADLEARRRRRQRGEPLEEAELAAFAAYHLSVKAQSGQIERQWLRAAQNHLEAAVQFFCNSGRSFPKDCDGNAILTGVADRHLASITVADVQEYTAWLSRRSNGRGCTLSASSQRKYLNSLSNLFRRAESEGRVPPGHNPVRAMIEKPQDGSGRREAKWLEVHEAALLLEAARLHTPEREAVAIPYLYPLLATFLLTGGRPSEVYGLEVGDISFDRKTVTFRPNSWRRLKTGKSLRTVPLWPQLEGVLREYFREEPRVAGLLFPSVRTGGLIRDIRKSLDAAAAAAGWRAGDIRPYAFRHTYTAARLQTLDNGSAVSTFTVARELGHGGFSLVQRVYGHLGQVRHRSDVVEYPIDRYRSLVEDRVRCLGQSDTSAA